MGFTASQPAPSLALAASLVLLAAASLARKRIARIDAAGRTGTRRAGHAVVTGHELAVAGMAPVTALEAIARRGSLRGGQAHGERTDCEEGGDEKLALERTPLASASKKNQGKHRLARIVPWLPPTADRRDPDASFYRALTTLAHYQVMTTRDNMSAVIRDLQRDHGLLAAYLEATDRIDWRALHKRVVIREAPEPINVEAPDASTAPQFSEEVPSTPQFAFRRANLVRVP
jgi:hypothetical protein